MGALMSYASRDTRRRDDEVFDDAIHDRKFWPKLVYKNGHGPRVRLMLTDAAKISHSVGDFAPRPVFDASRHRPR